MCITIDGRRDMIFWLLFNALYATGVVMIVDEVRKARRIHSG
jgi:hypothetical protein